MKNTYHLNVHYTLTRDILLQKMNEHKVNFNLMSFSDK